MTNTTDIPVAVAYFKVRIPGFSPLGVQYANDAERVVEDYLYNNGSVVVIDLDMSDSNHPAYIVMVRVENWKSVADLTFRVQKQRDRLSSGLYSSTEPKILFTPFADV